jgi:hypothetical protein
MEKINEKLYIKKYYFSFFMFNLYILKKILNKILKYIFSLINTISIYLSKELKPIK